MGVIYQLGGAFGSSLGGAIGAMMAACALPFVWAILAKALGGFGIKDNQDPRQFLAKAKGVSARANAAQLNSFESLPMFLAAVIVAIYCFVPQQVVNGLAWLYVVIRAGFGAAYLMNLATLRSVLWVLSMACVFMLFYLSLRMV